MISDGEKARGKTKIHNKIIKYINICVSKAFLKMLHFMGSLNVLLLVAVWW